jgi:hypothetical protein
VQKAFGADVAAAKANPTGHLPRQLKEISRLPQRTSSKMPTGEGAEVFKDAKGKPAGRHAPYEGEVIDDTAFGKNERTPEPTLGDGSKSTNKPPLGAKELPSQPLELGNPVKIDATSLKSVDDFRNALRSTSDNTIIVDNAESLGFHSPRVVIHGGDPVGDFAPDHALDSFGTPYLSASQFLQAIKAAGMK